MPGLGRYPCGSCHYVAGNRRMLARHAVLIHSDKVFKCPVCPFITRYAANWYRHKRDLHGLTKITNCEVCGFFANSTAELASHKETEHPEHLQLEKYEDKYAKEKLRLSAKSTPPSNSNENTSLGNFPADNPSLSHFSADNASVSLSTADSGSCTDDNPSAVFEPITVIEEVEEELETGDLQIDIQTNVTEDLNDLLDDDDDFEKLDESVTFSLPLNGLGDEFGANGGDKNTSLTSDVGTSPDNLGPLKVKRSYNCFECGLLTSNPREYLYHLRTNHGEKINIYECKYCIYASKHIQKLQRHCNLVHRQLIAKDPDYHKQLEALKEKKVKQVVQRPLVPILPKVLVTNGVVNQSSPNILTKSPIRGRNQVMLKCSVCPYQTRNQAFLQHHEKTVHLKKKIYRCPKCGYVTNEKGRYTKHIRYHSLPKTQCEHCFFQSAYKWNMDRHMKNHEVGAEGAFKCTTCNFTTSTKQSFKSHVTNHHNSSPVEDFEEQEEMEEDMDNLNDSAEWEDIDVEVTEEEGFMTPDESASHESNDFVEPKDNSEMVWKDGKAYQKVLQCKLCDFKAAWPFELKKHEENHRSQKKHECPLCGMRFEHIAWLTKHLRRVHQENSQAKNIAAAYELMKPTRRRPGKEYAVDSVLPIFQDVLKQNKAPQKQQVLPEPSKNSMLSTLLNKPLQPFLPTSLNKFNSRYKSKAFASATNMSRQLTIGSFYDKPQTSESPSVSNQKKNVPTCNVCGYKTRWISELQRHMRVHSQEKPFHCPKCKYHCKWKGDLNRHLMKYHGIKVPSSTKKQGFVPKLKLRKSINDLETNNDWQHVNPEVKRSLFQSTSSRSLDADAPLDLTIKDTFPNPYLSTDMYEDPYEFSSPNEGSSRSMGSNDPTSNFKSPLQHLSEASYPAVDSPTPTKRKYQCPFCTFGTTTASRFHVHIVQHYNRRPFQCSVCEYNSNWEWDITKHIKLKNCKDKFQNKACVLLTDESGRRNYEKYEKYLVDINAPPPVQQTRPPGVSVVQDINSAHNVNRSQVESPSKNCSYDFRNIGSNFEDTPENIVVTPDINISDAPEGMNTSQSYYNNQSNSAEMVHEKGGDAKWFYCKHCNFKHATKRVVISHLSVHAGIKPFRCRACGITSNWRHVIVRHVKDAHNGYMNEVEDRISYTQEGFALRLTSINQNNQEVNPNQEPQKPYVPKFGCKICPYKCDKEFYIKFHMKQHRPREGAVYRCEYCPYFVKFKKTLIRHMKLHMPSSASTAINESLDFEDIDETMSENQYQPGNSHIPDAYDMYDPLMNDPVDDSIAISFAQLNQFSFSDPVSPPKIKRHICENCPYKTDNKTQYLYHKQFHRPNPSAPFKCTVCSYWATMQHLLTQHMKVHSEAEGQSSPKEGESSEKTFSNANLSPSDNDWMDKMSVVFVKRDGEIVKMFKCNYCPMMNKKKANVRVHQKMHGVIVNDGKFACSYCDYQCLNQGGLTNHIKIHQKVPEKEIQGAGESEGQNNFNAEDSSGIRKKFMGYSYFCMKCPALFKSSSDLELHSKFHGSGMQFGCTMCDYRTRHKTHLVKHLTVHSPEYMAKRQAAQGPAVNNSGISSFGVADPMLAAIEIPLVKKIDQMLLLEASEMNVAMKKTGEAAALLQKCVFCPAPFFKTSTLAYHISLHGSEGEFKCTQCDYAVNRSANLTAHSLLHPKKKPPAKPRKPPLRTFPCTKCPAVFYKQDRFDRHSELHGKNYKYQCKDCDYSVRFAANLIKHRNLHAAHAKPDAENALCTTKAPDNTLSTYTTPVVQPLVESSNYVDSNEKKVMFICDRCPYAMNRKDAVQSHSRRHWLRDGFKCPYCDYTSMQSGFTQSHIKMHIQPSSMFPAQAFMKYESFKIFVKDSEDSEETLLFDDQEMVKNKDSGKSKRKHRFDDGSNKKKMQKLSSEPSNSYSSEFANMPFNSKVPVVVLSDVLANKELMKWAPRLKIPKLKLTKCADSTSSEKIYSKLNISYDSEAKLQTSWAKPKPSLVVKISKVENSNKNEKTIYSVCTKTSEPEDFSNSKDSIADSGHCSNAAPSRDNSISPSSVSVEEATLVSDSGFDDLSKTLNLSQESIPINDEENDLKSDESFSSDSVPVSDSLSKQSPKITVDDANSTNDVHLTNGLDVLPGEIEEKL